MLHRLRYDENTKTYSNAEDVETVVEPVESFGGTDAVEDIGIPAYEVPAYKDFIQYFVDRGYTRGGDFRAAPYDWRYAAGTLNALDLVSLAFCIGRSRSGTVIVAILLWAICN